MKKIKNNPLLSSTILLIVVMIIFRNTLFPETSFWIEQLFKKEEIISLTSHERKELALALYNKTRVLSQKINFEKETKYCSGSSFYEGGYNYIDEENKIGYMVRYTFSPEDNYKYQYIIVIWRGQNYSVGDNGIDGLVSHHFEDYTNTARSHIFAQKFKKEYEDNVAKEQRKYDKILYNLKKFIL